MRVAKRIRLRRPGRPATRWGRCAVLFGGGLGATAAMASCLWGSVFGLQADLVIENSNGISFATSKLVANDAGFGMTVVTKQNGAKVDALRAGFAGASMNGLCVSRTESIGGINVTLTLSAGDGDPGTNEISALNAGFDLADLTAKGDGIQLQGSAQIGVATPDITTTPTNPGQTPPYTGYEPNPLGQLSSDFSNGLLEGYDSSVYDATGNGGKANGQGYTGVDVTAATLTTVYGTLYDAQITGSITLPNLKIKVTPGSTTCQSTALSTYNSSGYFSGID